MFRIYKLTRYSHCNSIQINQRVERFLYYGRLIDKENWVLQVLSKFSVGILVPEKANKVNEASTQFNVSARNLYKKNSRIVFLLQVINIYLCVKHIKCHNSTN